METTFNEFLCLWCGCAFSRRHHFGRKPSYCCHAHRQRAYESRRRGAHRQDRPALPRSGIDTPPTRQVDYPGGSVFDSWRYRKTIHALRGDTPVSPRGTHLTLCGTWARYRSTSFAWSRRNCNPGDRSCATCESLVQQFPAAHSTDYFSELSALRAALAQHRQRTGEAWLAPLIARCFPPSSLPPAQFAT